MNRRHNPLVALVALLLLAVLLLLIGCSAPAAAEEVTVAEPESSPRFIIEHSGMLGSITQYSIVTDTETGVQYLYIKSANSGGLTVLQPAPEEMTTS
jgi:hypothetical protein